ncbi:MAG: NAD-dependent epimerase/dehydratase family protein, partial [Anaerolineae bacterium]
AKGFIGRALARKLADRGYEVRCLVRDPANATAPEADGVRLVKGDITDKVSMRAAMDGADAVFHVAGWYAMGVRDVRRMHAINVDGARNTLGLAAELGVPKILHTSTVGVFGNTRGRVVDETYRAPKDAMTSAYEVTKWIAHYEVAEVLQRQGAPVIIVQPGGVTGPGDQSPHIQVFDMFLRRSPVMLGARSGITLAHVDDIAEGHVLALEKGTAGGTYILAGEALTYKRLFEMCEKLTGTPAAKFWLPGWAAQSMSGLMAALERAGMRGAFSSEGLATMNDYTYWASADKAQRELGWRRRPLEETLRDALTYLQARQ